MKILSLCLSMIGSWEEENKFEQLYWQYKDLLHYCAMGKVHDVHRAEEAVNTAFLHVAKNMQMVDEAISPRTKRLLVTIVERTAINLYKKDQLEIGRTVNMDDIEPHMLRGYTEEDQTLAQAILQLPLNYRQPILLKYSLGYSTEETAAILDYSVAKTRKLITRGKQKLEQILKEEKLVL